MPCILPPPLTPPHKGEGDLSAFRGRRQLPVEVRDPHETQWFKREIHTRLAERPSRHLGARRRAGREARAYRAGCRKRRRSGGEAESFHHRPRRRGQAPSQRRQAAGVQGRHRLRRGGGRVRRPQRQDRHDRRIRAHGQLHPRHQDHAGGAPRARRRLAGHAGVGAGAGALRQPRGHHRAGHPRWRASSASATPTSWASPIPSSR